VPLFAILAGAILAWCGFQGLSAITVVDRTLRGQGLPDYSKGSGLTDLLGPLLGFELLKSSLSGGGLSKLLSGVGGGGGGGGGESPPEEEPPGEGEIPIEGEGE
jgi:hypothetical protein